MLSADQLAAKRREKGQTREQLSYLLGYTPKWLLFIEQGRIPLTREVHDSISRAIDLLVDTKNTPGPL